MASGLLLEVKNIVEVVTVAVACASPKGLQAGLHDRWKCHFIVSDMSAPH